MAMIHRIRAKTWGSRQRNDTGRNAKPATHWRPVLASESGGSLQCGIVSLLASDYTVVCEATAG